MVVNLRKDQDFVSNLTKTVEANLSNEHFGVSDLAEKTGISRSQIHRKLKIATNQSVSQFIREVRLNKAKELLGQNIGTISEIAYKVGFGSPSYFIKCFHEYYGYAPGEYIKYAHIISDNKSKDKTRITFTKRSLYLVFLVLVISLIITVWMVYGRERKFSPGITDKSIAVLPLKNAITDPETQILADGILEDILIRLSHIREFKVKSRNSSEVYRNSTKTTPEIASELGVSYLLEGTILKEGEKIKIYIQLIDAINDNHIWSAEYDKELSGIFDFTSEVSTQIASELKTVLSESERKFIEKVYTENTDAYRLYQKGRFFWHRRSEQGLKTSIDYFNQAIKLDPGYSLAWAGLSDSYLILTFWGWYPWDEGFLKSRKYALKAIRLDENLAEPHVALGSMELYYNQNWNFAEKEFLKSIEINPNYSNAYLFYADYLNMLGRNEEGRQNMDKAIELFPNALINYHVSSGMYFNLGKWDEALMENDKLLEINKDFKPSYSLRFKIYFFKGEGLKAIDALNHYLLLDSPDENYHDILNKTFAENGIEGVIYWLIDYHKNRRQQDLFNLNNHFTIARLYGMLGDRDKVLEHFKQGFKRGKSADICYIYCNYEFKFLHDDPEFIAFLKKAKIPLN